MNKLNSLDAAWNSIKTQWSILLNQIHIWILALGSIINFGIVLYVAFLHSNIFGFIFFLT